MNTQMNRNYYGQANTMRQAQNNRIELSYEQMSAIYAMIGEKQNTVIYTAPEYDYGRKVYAMADNSAAKGDLCHLICHGYTLGSVVYQMNRANKWAQIARNAYQRGINSNLKTYKWNPLKKGFFLAFPEQVLVMGNKYMTLHMEGELSRKEIYFSSIVRLEYVKNGLKIVVDDVDGKYRHIEIYNIFDEMADIVANIVLNTIRARL